VLGRRAASQELVALGERIRERRTELRLSQEALAEKAEISANTVSRIEGGQMSMSIGTFIKLTRALDADAGSLLGLLPGQGEKQYQDICYRISHLRECDRKTVLRTVEALVESLRRER
jgi:transcriptional regulator with XRE-family HTH domain